jgi:hypothetical protein
LRPSQPWSKQLLFHQASLSFVCVPLRPTTNVRGIFFRSCGLNCTKFAQLCLSYKSFPWLLCSICGLLVMVIMVEDVDWKSVLWLMHTPTRVGECKRMWVLSTLKCESPFKLEFLNLSNLLSKIAKGKLCTNQEFFIVENVLK